jgi:transposase
VLLFGQGCSGVLAKWFSMLGLMVDESAIRERWLLVRDELDERARRIWAAAEARSHGRGGIAAVVRATGIAESTIRRGIAEVRCGERAPEGRVRRPGAGRRSIEDREPGLVEALLGLIEGATRGDPESPLLWTSRSVARLTEQLRELGYEVHESTVRRQLKGLGYSLQANRKSHEGSDHPDRDGQFARIAEVSAAAVAAGEPLISVDTKKKELIGNYKNGGRELAATGTPILVNTHDFPDKEQGKAVPYGIYDVGSDEGWVSVGISADTAQFAVAAINGWWEHLGAARYPNASTLTITADCGGSNSYRTRLWKTELQALADDTGLKIRVLHYPPGTSKWNKIEHRLFSYISINWRAKPLVSRQTVIDLIASTTTSTGLKVYARLDTNSYPTKIQVTDEQMHAVKLTGEDFHPEWNYNIIPSLKKK